MSNKKAPATCDRRGIKANSDNTYSDNTEFAAQSQYETAFSAAMVRALRRRAAALREQARTGETIVEQNGKLVSVKSPESAHAQRVAADWQTIADEIEGEAQQ